MVEPTSLAAKDLNSEHAFHLVEQVQQAEDDASFKAAAQEALTELIEQFPNCPIAPAG